MPNTQITLTTVTEEKAADILDQIIEQTPQREATHGLAPLPGMRPMTLRAGKKKYIHVSPTAIMYNRRYGHCYPTCVVLAEGSEYFVHAVQLMGQSQLAFRPHNGIVEASSFIETDGEVICWTDPSAEQGKLPAGCG